MLGNLVANAIRYTHEGGVLVGCRQRGRTLTVAVWDTGIGIPLLGDTALVVHAPPELAVSGDALTGRCVIVIDDEAAIREGMHELLSQWGCTSLEAPSATQALEVLSAISAVPDLVLADYRLTQGSNGADAVQLLRQRFGSALPALLITGDTGPERLREAKKTGLHVLHKPVRPAQLRALCNYLLTRR